MSVMKLSSLNMQFIQQTTIGADEKFLQKSNLSISTLFFKQLFWNISKDFLFVLVSIFFISQLYYLKQGFIEKSTGKSKK